MKKVLFVATVVKTHIMEFHLPYLRLFKENGWETAVAARNDYENPADCVIPYCDRYYDLPFARSPWNADNGRAYKVLKALVDAEKYDIIHCHTPMGAVLTRLAARQTRKQGTKVFYTAHGFHFYKGAPAINWLLYYPIERWLARYTDVLITINKEDYERARHFRAGKVCYVPGVGIDLTRFQPDRGGRAAKRTELGLGAEDFVLLSVGELIPRKNHEVVLRALALLRQQGEADGVRYLICGQGDCAEKLKRLTEELGISDCVSFLGYRNDIQAICGCSDLFLFMSRQEGLPVALMEAMACGLPAICSNIRGNVDLVEDGISGAVVQSTPAEVAEAICCLRADGALRARLAAAAREQVKRFDLTTVIPQMAELYMML